MEKFELYMFVNLEVNDYSTTYFEFYLHFCCYWSTVPLRSFVTLVLPKNGKQ